MSHFTEAETGRKDVQAFFKTRSLIEYSFTRFLYSDDLGKMGLSRVANYNIIELFLTISYLGKIQFKRVFIKTHALKILCQYVSSIRNPLFHCVKKSVNALIFRILTSLGRNLELFSSI